MTLAITGPAIVALQLQSAPESVTLVRAGLKGLAKRLEFEPDFLDDLQMAASEACNNVVLHAYSGDPGPLDVMVTAAHDGVDVVVRDHGMGMAPPRDDEAPADDDVAGVHPVAEHEEAESGLGLLVIDSLSDSADLLPVAGGGTELRMHFARDLPLVRPSTGAPGVRASAVVGLAGDVVASVAPVPLLSAVLGRLARALAAQARFSVERFSKLQFVVESIVRHTQQQCASESGISVSLGTETRRLRMSIGPLRALAEGDEGLVPLLRRLADRLEIEQADESQLLSLTVSEAGLV